MIHAENNAAQRDIPPLSTFAAEAISTFFQRRVVQITAGVLLVAAGSAALACKMFLVGGAAAALGMLILGHQGWVHWSSRPSAPIRSPSPILANSALPNVPAEDSQPTLPEATGISSLHPPSASNASSLSLANASSESSPLPHSSSASSENPPTHRASISALRTVQLRLLELSRTRPAQRHSQETFSAEPIANPTDSEKSKISSQTENEESELPNLALLFNLQEPVASGSASASSADVCSSSSSSSSAPNYSSSIAPFSSNFIPGVMQEPGDGKEAPQISRLERATVLLSTAREKLRNLGQSRHCQSRFLSHERYKWLTPSSLSPCTSFSGDLEPGAYEIIKFIKPATTPKEFDDECLNYPEYQLTHGGRCGWNALGTAAKQGNVALIDHIVQKGGLGLLELGNRFGRTPLFCAAAEGQYAAAKRLIQLGAKVSTAASISSESHRSKGPRKNTLFATKANATPLWAALHADVPHVSLINLLLSRHAVLHPPLKQTDVEAIKLLEEGCQQIQKLYDQVNIHLLPELTEIVFDYTDLIDWE